MTLFSIKGKTARLLSLLALFFLCLPSIPLFANTLPSARREDAERFFGRAYENFLRRNYSNALADLD